MSRPHRPIPPATPLSARFFDGARIGFNAGIDTSLRMKGSDNRVARRMPDGQSTVAIGPSPGLTLWCADDPRHTLDLRHPACTAVTVTAKDGMHNIGQVFRAAPSRVEATG